MIETRLLYYFLTVAKEQNITNAAKALHITQPTLSRQIAMLEDELGTKLFDRNTRQLTLTDAGYLLRRKAEEILELMEKTEEEVSAKEEQVEGKITIGYGEMVSVKLLAKMIGEFSSLYPRVVFDIYTAHGDEVKSRIDDGLVDIGLLLEPVDTERYEYIRMPVKERWVAAIPSRIPCSGNEYVTAEELAKLPTIVPSRRRIYNELTNWFGEYSEILHIIGYGNLGISTAMMVQAGLGYALTLEGVLSFSDQADVRMVPLYPELLSTSVLAWKRGQPFPTAGERFIQFAHSYLEAESE